MTPILDRTTGKTVGWTLVMNIVSITKRQKFFEILEGAFKKEASEKKFLFAYAPFFGAAGVYDDLIRGLTKGLSGNILVIGEMHGLISAKLAENPMIKKVYILSKS